MPSRDMIAFYGAILSNCDKFIAKFKAVKRNPSTKCNFFYFFFKNHVSRPLPPIHSLHWREFDPVEIETAVIDIGHREDMTSRLQRDE